MNRIAISMKDGSTALSAGGEDMFRSGFLLMAGNTGGALLSFARNVLIARLISVEDFGIAASFAILVALIEMASNVGLDRLLVQAREGDDRDFVAGLHGLQLARGVLTAPVLLALAYPYALFLGTPEITWAYQLMALVSLLRGALNFDMVRVQRHRRFRPIVIVECVSMAAGLAVVMPLLWLFGDWRAMLGSILLQQLVYVALSHLVAEWRWQLRWRPQVLRRALRFGLPLLATNVLLFGTFQGDRLIIGNRLGMAELGIFSVAFMLTLIPTMILAKSLQSLILPQLSRLEDGPAFSLGARATLEAALCIGTGLALFFALFGPPILVLVFGAKYALGAELLIWLSIMQAVSLVKAGTAIVAIARAETTNPMVANLMRVAALPASFVALSLGGGLLAVAWIALGAELMGLAAAMVLLKRRTALRLGGLGLPFGAAAGLLGLIGLNVVLVPPEVGLGHFHPTQLGLVGAFLVFLGLALPDLRQLTVRQLGIFWLKRQDRI